MNIENIKFMRKKQKETKKKQINDSDSIWYW